MKLEADFIHRLAKLELVSLHHQRKIRRQLVSLFFLRFDFYIVKGQRVRQGTGGLLREKRVQRWSSTRQWTESLCKVNTEVLKIEPDL